MNLKKILLTSFIAMNSVALWAVPAKRDLRTYQQADGSLISLRLIGDEHFHTFVTTDDLTVARGADGGFYYQSAEGLSDVMAHDPKFRNSREESFIREKNAKLTVGELKSKHQAIIDKRKAKPLATRSGFTQVPNQGSPHVPILLVQYSDIKFKDADPKATFDKFFAHGSTSASQYFIDQSNGKYSPQFDVYGPVTLSGKRSTYGGNDYWGNDKALGKMVAEAAVGLDKDVDFNIYDNDGDGECDVLIVLYAGVGEASSEVAESVWPCQWELQKSDYGKSLKLDGITVDKFAVFNELNGTNTRKIDGIGTFCHEFSHCLSLPDFYDTNYTYFGMGPWSLMDYGSYNDDSYTPIGYSAYEKAFMGWIDIEEGAQNKLYTLPVFNSGDIATDRAVKLTNPLDKNEYFILENRRQQGWDRYMPTDGLLIYHVAYSPSVWESNSVNSTSKQCMTPVPADNELRLDSYGYIDEANLLGDLWPYNGNNEWTNTSKPSQTVYTGNFLGKPVTEITDNADGTISFWVMKGMLEKVQAPTLLEHEINSASSVTINWESVPENDVTFSIEMKERSAISDPVLTLSTTFDSSAHGWATEGYAKTERFSGNAKYGIRLGSASQNGKVTSPNLSGDASGLVTVRFNAVQYNLDDMAAIVTLCDASGNALDTKEIHLDDTPSDYTVILEVEPETDFAISFSTPDKKKRFYLFSADIYLGDASENLGTRSEEYDYRLVENIEETTYTFTDLKPGVIYDYRIKAVPRDTENYAESDWSERRTLNLSDVTGINDILEQDSDIAPAYYTLEGIRLDKPTVPGVYILRIGSTTRKIRI